MAASWENFLPTGCEPLDRAHDAQSGCLRELLHAVNDVDTRRAAGAVEGLLRVSREHFGAEEQLMRASGFPQLSRHKEAHDLFLADVARFTRQVATRGITPEFRRWATGRVLEWFRLHVAANDVALGAFLRAKQAGALDPLDPPGAPGTGATTGPSRLSSSKGRKPGAG